MFRRIALLAAALAFVLLLSGCRMLDEAAYRMTLSKYDGYVQSLQQFSLSVTENGEPVGTYTLADLGLEKKALERINAYFDVNTLGSEEDFLQNPWHDSILAQGGNGFSPLSLDASPSLDAIWKDLGNDDRPAPVDAHVELINGRYQVVSSQEATRLNEETVRSALHTLLADVTLEPTDTPVALTLELTDFDCYAHPAVTENELVIDYPSLLARDYADVQIVLHFGAESETLSGKSIGALLTVDDKGRISVNEDALNAKLEAWNARYTVADTPFRFHSVAQGAIELKEQLVSYTLQTDTLRSDLEKALKNRKNAEINAEVQCVDKNGNTYDIGDTYVEVDIDNQRMVYFENGEIVVDTPVVTGAYGLDRGTITGVYSVTEKKQNRWLVGADYRVFVNYWLRFKGGYGIHDSTWRTEYGTQRYRLNGSHGCVNTPMEAMTELYSRIEVGCPVIVHQSY